MISKERLEQLIEQGATVWHNEWEEIKLDKNNHEICEVKTLTGKHIGWCLSFEYEYEGKKLRTEVELDDLEEDVETAKWHYEMDCERTEKLVLPTWEEFNNEKDAWFHGEDGTEYHLFKSETVIHLMEDADEEAGWGLTKENYIEACRLAKKLFLGEE